MKRKSSQHDFCIDASIRPLRDEALDETGETARPGRIAVLKRFSTP
jgi:hypothetical protein